MRLQVDTTQLAPEDSAALVSLFVINARKRLGLVNALDGVSLEVRRGEVLGIAGPNGSGKSTLLRAIAGVTRLDEGEIAVGGHFDPTRAEVRRQIGFVSQDVALYERLSCDENLRFFGALHGLFGELLEKRILEALELAELSDRRRARVASLSGGMKRRLHFATTLLSRPSLLLLDEPTAGIDSEHRERLLSDVRELSQTGVSVVLATHHSEEVAAICDRVATMVRGKIIQTTDLCEETAVPSWLPVPPALRGRA